MITGSVILAGCAGDLSTLSPAGPAAGSIAFLWWFSLALLTTIFVAVLGLICAVVALARRGRRIPFSPAHWIIGGGIIMPAPILAGLVGLSIAIGEDLKAGSRDDGRVRIDVTARQWAWSFRYPEFTDARSEAVVHIPAGRTVEFRITSEDVIHSFWVPRLAGKADAVPGHSHSLFVVADAPGLYAGICAEYCGTGHHYMPFSVLAHDPESYAAVLADLAGQDR